MLQSVEAQDLHIHYNGINLLTSHVTAISDSSGTSHKGTLKKPFYRRSLRPGESWLGT